MKRWVAVVVCAGVVLGAWWFFNVQSGAIRIERGDSVSAVARALAQEKIISHPAAARLGFLLFGGGVVHPGTVTIGENCSLRCVIHRVTSSERAAARITLKEGDDVRDLVQLLIEKKIIDTPSELYAIVGAPARFPLGKEGYLFPDTYDVSQEGGVQELVSAMLENFERKFDASMRSRAAAAGHSIHDVVTMASILEKEVRGARDRRLVADILWRRAAAGWGLQVDASVNYVTGKSGRFTTREDRASFSAWNTYRHRGLPPGPIGNPGLAALKAALEPELNSFWFYLTAPDGTVHYGRTLAEHIANKKYLK